jgi:hypothetical protein
MNLYIFITFLLLLCEKIKCINIPYSECYFYQGAFFINDLNSSDGITYNKLEECLNLDYLFFSTKNRNRNSKIQVFYLPPKIECFKYMYEYFKIKINNTDSLSVDCVDFGPVYSETSYFVLFFLCLPSFLVLCGMKRRKKKNDLSRYY